MSVRQRHGITVPFDGVPLHAHREWFEEIAALGYTDLWSAESGGADAFTPLALAAAWTPSLRLGTAIVPAFTRGPFFFSSRRRHTTSLRDWSSDVCSSDLQRLSPTGAPSNACARARRAP